MSSKVAVVPCADYTPAAVKHALHTALTAIGGLSCILQPEQHILLKPNLVSSAKREQAVATDPAVMRALIQLLKEDGYSHISAGDSGSFHSKTNLTAQACGLDEVLREENVPLCLFETGTPTPLPDGNPMMIANEVLNCDALISVCKMKTHALERITGAVKNQYGCVSGMHKTMGHTRYPNAESFAHMLIQLNRLVSPKLYIMDGILAMEGNGPTSGDPISMGVLLVSTDPIALDTVFCHLVYLDPKLVPTNIAGQRLKLGTYEDIEIITPDGILSVPELQQKYGNPNFRVDRKQQRTKGILDFVGMFKLFQRRPYIDASLCRRCGVCTKCCPVEGSAVHFKNGTDKPPVYQYRKCIRCYCCQEMCPYHAIKVK